MTPVHYTQLSVRDYELDSQGIVNNAIYQNYLEHARHMMLKDLGFDFAKLHEEGWDPVVVRIEMDFRLSLRSGLNLVVRTQAETLGNLRYVFFQEIVTNDSKTALVAKTTVTFLFNGRPKFYAPLHKLL